MNDPKTLKESLRIIEGFTLAYQDSDKTLETAERILNDIYKVAHLHGTCENPHTNWRIERLTIKKSLKGII